jgi:hypothetical protein
MYNRLSWNVLSGGCATGVLEAERSREVKSFTALLLSFVGGAVLSSTALGFHLYKDTFGFSSPAMSFMAENDISD